MPAYTRAFVSLPQEPSDDDLSLWTYLWEEATGDQWGGIAWLESFKRLDVYVADTMPDADIARHWSDIFPREWPAPQRDGAGDPEAWSRAWREGFTPQQAGRFVVMPPWWTSPRPADVPPPQIPIVVEPAGAFGTGHHETTRLMLRAIDDLAQRGPLGRVVDLGSGSGVLAMAAIKLGATKPVVATEIDAAALPNAQENLEFNAIDPDAWDYRVTAELPRDAAPFDVVLCNMLVQEFLPLLPGIATLLGPKGLVLLAGLLNEDIDRVLTACAEVGLREEVFPERASEGAWARVTVSRNA